MRVRLNAKCRLIGVESVEPPVDVPGSENLGQHNSHAQHQVHGGKNHGKRPLALRLASCFPITSEDGDKSDGGGAAHQKIGDQVGQNECRIEGVGLNAPAEEPDDVLDPHQPDDARQKGGRHQHDRGGKNRMRMRRPQKRQTARPPRTWRGLGWNSFCHWC